MVADNDPASDAIDKALRLFVYGPVGLACYLRDSGPTFMEVFVSRGKREVDGAKRTVEEKLGLSKPEPAPAPSVQQRVADGLGRMASQAGNMVVAVAGPVVGAATGGSAPVTGAPTPAGPNGAAGSNGATANRTSASTTEAPTDGVSDVGPENASEVASADLPISGYDQLSASQVIERLEGLSRGALERIRVYELAHRARRTILASIDQLTR